MKDEEDLGSLGGAISEVRVEDAPRHGYSFDGVVGLLVGLVVVRVSHLVPATLIHDLEGPANRVRVFSGGAITYSLEPIRGPLIVRPVGDSTSAASAMDLATLLMIGPRNCDALDDNVILSPLDFLMRRPESFRASLWDQQSGA